MIMIDDFEFLSYVAPLPKNDEVLLAIRDSLNEQAKEMKEHIIHKTLREYARAKEELDNPPTAESLYKALKFARGITDFKDLIPSVCALGDGGLSFRIKGLLESDDYIDIDIYNDVIEYVLLHKKREGEVKVYSLTFEEIMYRVSNLQFYVTGNYSENTNSSRNK